jgi:putative mRNA 3-end processing factor
MFEIDVLSNGAVALTPEVVCDGFVHDAPVRAQTHIHDDHMDDFDRSKGFQDLIMSEPTRDLLVADRNADLPYRDNIIALSHGHAHEEGASRVRLLPSDHMLGSCQVEVERNDGLRIGYSGDFQWPMEKPMKVDVLVVDSTYGSPDSVRGYTQGEAEARFVELVLLHLKQGAVHVKAARGTIQRAIHLLGTDVRQPVLCSKRLCGEVEVYQRFGASVCEVTRCDSAEGKTMMADGRYIRMYSKGDGDPVENVKGVTIVLSAFMVPKGHVVLERSERAFRVALSNHADFQGTLDYVKATGAKKVITDNTRGPHGVILAQEIQSRLGLNVSPSRALPLRAWGGART